MHASFLPTLRHEKTCAKVSILRNPRISHFCTNNGWWCLSNSQGVDIWSPLLFNVLFRFILKKTILIEHLQLNDFFFKFFSISNIISARIFYSFFGSVDISILIDALFSLYVKAYSRYTGGTSNLFSSTVFLWVCVYPNYLQQSSMSPVAV